jgi:hypothetical protein
MKRERNIMNNPSDTLKSKVKTIHELSKEFPEKTYRELEKYRDADRNEEAQRIITQQENEELKEDQHKENWEEKYKEEQERSGYLQNELDRIKRENNDLHNKVAALLDAVDPEKTLKKARESGL